MTNFQKIITIKQYLKNIYNAIFPYKKIHLTTIKEQIEYVKKCWANIKNIKNPDKELQMIAVHNSPFAIWCIKNPNKNLQLEAIKQSRFLIKWIKNPCREAIRLAKLKEKLEKLK